MGKIRRNPEHSILRGNATHPPGSRASSGGKAIKVSGVPINPPIARVASFHITFNPEKRVNELVMNSIFFYRKLGFLSKIKEQANYDYSSKEVVRRAILAGGPEGR